MKIKNKIKFLTISIMLTFSFILPVSATTIDNFNNSDIELMYLYVKSGKSQLNISNGIATIKASMKSDLGVDKSLITSRLQKKVNGEWKTVEAWTVSKVGTTCSLEKTKSVSKGYEYRVFSTMKSYKGDKSESVASFSEVVKY